MDEREIVLMVARGDLQADEADALLEAAQRNGSRWPTRALDEVGDAGDWPALEPTPVRTARARRGKLSPDTLIALASTGVTPEWIRAVREAGVEDLGGDTLVGLAGNGVTPEWIRAIGESGVALDGGTLVALAGTGVTPEWILSLKDAGLGDLDGATLVGLAGSDVTPEWIEAITAELGSE